MSKTGRWKCFCAAALVLIFISPRIAVMASEPGYIDGRDYAARSTALIDYLAQAKPSNPDFPKEAMSFYIARLLTGRDMDFAISSLNRMVDVTLKEKRQDPFNLHAIMHGYFLSREKIPADLAGKFKAYAAGWDYSRPIGVSLNYELMRDGGGYLAAQQWPDLHDKGGNDAAKICSLCGGRLRTCFENTTHQNNGEYDSPLYSGTDYMAIRMLSEFSKDESLRQRARMTLEWMLVQAGCHWDHGYYITSSGRAKYWGSSNLSPDSVGPTTGMAYLLFGGNRPQDLSHCPAAFWLAHPGTAMPTDWLPEWQAALPLPRTVRASALMPSHKVLVRKMAWLTDSYGLASEREDGSPADSYEYKECRRTMLKWISDKPGSTFAFLQASRRRPNEKIANAFAYGENPYAQVMQHDGTLIGIYNVPDDYGFWKLQLPFTQSGAILKRIERDGWIFCHGGSILFAVKSIEPGVWVKPNAREHLDLMECDAKRNGYVLETSAISAFAGDGVDAELGRFANAVVSRTGVTVDLATNPPKLSFKNLAGHTLQITWHPPGEPYNGQCVYDGAAEDYLSYPMLNCPTAVQPVNGPLVIQMPEHRLRTLDFEKWIDR